MKYPELLDGLVRVPPIFLQSGHPLRMNLYKYSPIEQSVELFARSGDVLALEPFLTLWMDRMVLILVKQADLAQAWADHELQEAS